MQITISKAETLKTKPDDDSLSFGTTFTDHMLNMDYGPDKGWHNPRIEPYRSFQLDPSTMVFHYGQAVFEGMKAYRTQEGAIQLFRPWENFRRMNRSSRMLCIPEVDEDFALAALKQLLTIEKDWGGPALPRPPCTFGRRSSPRTRFWGSAPPTPIATSLFCRRWAHTTPKVSIR